MSKILTLIFIQSLLLLASCSNSVDDIPMDGKFSPLSLGPVLKAGNSQSTSENNEFWSEIKNQSSTDVQICIKDRGSLEDLVDEPFDVLDTKGNRVNKHARTDHNGCVTWNVSEKFDFLSPEQFVVKEYRIRYKGPFEFEKQVRLGYNPWSHEVIDLSRQTLRTSSFNLAHIKLGENLLLQDVQFKKLDDLSSNVAKEGYLNYSYQLLMQPHYNRIDINGDTNSTTLPIIKGQYDVQIELYELNYQNNQYFQIANGSLDKISAENGKIDAIVEVKLHPDARTNLDSPVFIKIQVIPQDVKSLNPFIGVQLMDGLLQLKEDDLINRNLLSNSHIFGFLDQEITHLPPAVTNFPIKKVHEQAKISDVLEESAEQEELPTAVSHRIKILDVVFEDLGNVNSFDNKNTSERVRRVDISAIMHDELIGIKGDAVDRGEFPVEVKIISKVGANKDDKFIGTRTIRPEPNGKFKTTVYLPYDLYGKEKNIHFDLIITGTTGKYKDIKITKRLAYNTWSKKGFDTDVLPEEAITDADYPQIKVSELELAWPKIDFKDNILVDRNLNLGFNLDFQSRLELFYDRQKNIGEDQADYSIEFGEYSVEAFILSPKNSDALFNIAQGNVLNLENFHFVTAAQSTAKVIKGVNTGFLDLKLSFPLTIAEIPIQHLKNLLVMHIKPVGKNNNLKPLTIATSFSARAKKQNERYFGHREELIDLLKSNFPEARRVIENGLRYKMTKIIQQNKDVDSLEVYRDKLSYDFKEKALFPSWESFTSASSDLISTHLKTIHRGRNAKFHFAKAACEYHFLETLKINSEKIKNNYSEYKVLKEQYLGCLNTPLKFFTVIPTAHIEKVLDEKTFEYEKNALSKAEFIKQVPYQKVQKGKTFFSGTGERVAVGAGSRESDQLIYSAKISAESPAPFYLNVSAMKNKVYETYKYINSTRENFDADRNYLTVVNNSQYEVLELKVRAKVKRCVKIFNELYLYHLCQDSEQIQSIHEKWFQISTEYSLSERGIITDGELSQNSGYQLIRGSFNFASQWNAYKTESQMQIQDITEMIDIPRGLNENSQFKGASKVPYDSLIQNAFPGVFIQPIKELN